MVAGSRSLALATLLALLVSGARAGAAPLDPARAAVRPAPAVPSDSAAVPSDLAPSAEPPWNPSRPVPAPEAWETAVRAPVLVAAAPFLVIGLGVKAGLQAVESTHLVPSVSTQLLRLANAGFEVGPATLGDRTGAGGELRWRPPFAHRLVGGLSASTGGYNRERVTVEPAPLGLEYRSEWRPEDLFFGLGPGSREAGVSNFATFEQSARVEIRVPRPAPPPRSREVIGDAADDPFTHDPLRAGLRVWAGPRDAVVLDGREHNADHPPLLERHPVDAVGVVGVHVEQLAWGARAELDARQGRPHWWRGGRATLSMERFDRAPGWLAFRDPRDRVPSFTRWTWEGEWATSFWRDPRTLRLRVRVVDRSGALAPGAFLLTDLATLGGSAGLSGFEPGRFRDADLVHGVARYIYPLGRFLEMDLHAEAGNVLPRLEAARLDRLHGSGGVALRARTPYATFASMGLDWSRETTRFSFAIGGVE